MKIDYGDWYSEEYWKSRKTYQEPNGAVKTYHGPSLAWDGFNYVADGITTIFPQKGVLLDIGCGGGDLAARLMKRGFDCYGVDISKYAVENCVPEMKGRLALADISTSPAVLTPPVFIKGTDDLIKPPGGPVTGWMQPFPAVYDIIMATDLLEHIYQEDLDKTFTWMMDLSKRWLFFCVATSGSPEEFVHKKGESVPIRWQGTAVSGHVNVRGWRYWAKYFASRNLTIRWDLMYILQMQRESHPDWRNTGGWNMETTWVLEKR